MTALDCQIVFSMLSAVSRLASYSLSNVSVDGWLVEPLGGIESWFLQCTTLRDDRAAG
jgi:hypothetical protein